jgi:hypothetical protein
LTGSQTILTRAAKNPAASLKVCRLQVLAPYVRAWDPTNNQNVLVFELDRKHAVEELQAQLAHLGYYAPAIQPLNQPGVLAGKLVIQP